MQIRKIVLLFAVVTLNIFGWTAHSLHAQDVRKIDSLKKQLSLVKTDKERGHIYHQITTLYVEHRPDTALTYINELIAIGNKTRDTFFLIVGQLQLGNAHDNLGNLTLSIEANNKGLELAILKHDTALMADAYSNIGLLYTRQDNADAKSLEYYRKALTLREQINDRALNQEYLNIGNLYMRNAQYDSAIYYCEKALAVSDPERDPIGTAYAYNALGTIYFMQNDFTKSILYFEKGKAIKEKQDDKRGLVSAYANIGEAYGALGKYDVAVENLNVAAAIAHSIKNKYLLREVYFTLASVYAKKGDYENAYKTFQLYTSYRDSVFGEQKARDILDIQTKYETARQNRENELLKQNNDIQAESLRRKDLLTYVIGGFLFLALVGAFFIFRAYAQKKKANLEISRQKVELEVKNKEVFDSITYAKRIQYTLLAHDDLLKKHLSDHFVLFRPKDIVSGDFYWASEKGDSFYLAVCDSTGHGVPGAFMSLLNTSFLNEAITEKNIASPEKILNYVRDRLVNSVSKEGAQDGMDGTLVHFRRNNGSLSISYASANTNPVLVRGGETMELSADKMPVGLGNENKDFGLHTVKTEPGDILYLFTDGYADQFGGPRGKKFKYKQLYELLRTNASKDMDAQRKILETALDTWRGNLEQVDDVCVIGIRV